MVTISSCEVNVKYTQHSLQHPGESKQQLRRLVEANESSTSNVLLFR